MELPKVERLTGSQREVYRTGLRKWIQGRARYLDGHGRTKWEYEYDSQRSKLYWAEEASGLCDQGAELNSVDEVQEYVDDMIARRWWGNRFWVSRITVKDGRGRRSAGAMRWGLRRGVITMPRFARCELYVLHEVAHVLARIKPHSPHGRLFVKMFLELVRWRMGNEAYRRLRDAFRHNNVRWYPHRKLVVPTTEIDFEL